MSVKSESSSCKVEVIAVRSGKWQCGKHFLQIVAEDSLMLKGRMTVD